MRVREEETMDDETATSLVAAIRDLGTGSASGPGGLELVSMELKEIREELSAIRALLERLGAQ